MDAAKGGTRNTTEARKPQIDENLVLERRKLARPRRESKKTQEWTQGLVQGARQSRAREQLGRIKRGKREGVKKRGGRRTHQIH